MSNVTAYTADIHADIAGRGAIVVGGMDMSNCVRGFTLSSHVGGVTQLQLELVLPAKVQAGALVEVDAETHALLVHLGWTPPPPAPSLPTSLGDGPLAPPGQ